MNTQEDVTDGTTESGALTEVQFALLQEMCARGGGPFVLDVTEIPNDAEARHAPFVLDGMIRTGAAVYVGPQVWKFPPSLPSRASGRPAARRHRRRLRTSRRTRTRAPAGRSGDDSEPLAAHPAGGAS